MAAQHVQAFPHAVPPGTVNWGCLLNQQAFWDPFFPIALESGPREKSGTRRDLRASYMTSGDRINYPRRLDPTGLSVWFSHEVGVLC